MSRQYWGELLSWATASGTPIANSTAETIIFPNVTIPANYLQDGRSLRLKAAGSFSTTGTPTLIFFLRWGGVAGVLIAKSATITTPSGVTTAIWELEIAIQTRSNGATGTVFAVGTVFIGAATGTAGARHALSQGGGTIPAVATLDLATDTALAFSAQWGTANASNTLTGTNYTLEALN